MPASPSLPRPLLAALLAAALLGPGCSGDKVESKQMPPKRPPVPVAVALVEQKPVPLQIQAIGTVEASAVISVKAQVGGELLRVHIKEGQDVKKGDVLFTIDPRPYEAALAQAEANLARDRGQIQQARAVLERDRARIGQSNANLLRDQAQAKNAQVQERRYADLLQKGLIAQEQFDGIRTQAESLAATVRADEADISSAEETVRADEAAVRSAEQSVRADEASVENARLQVSYTTIRSPVDGRTGSLMLNEGNIVRVGGTGDSTLLVINQVRPIYVTFTVPQQQLPAVNRYMATGKLQVDAFPAGQSKPSVGVVSFIDNAVDPATGTIRLKATFPNDQNQLWPGQFVNVALTLANEPDAIVIPSQAVQTGQQGAYVFVLKPDATVEVRPIGVARAQGNETIVAKGLEKGESVVTDGQPRLVAGAKVEVARVGGGGRGRDGARETGARQQQPADGADKKADGAGKRSDAAEKTSDGADKKSDGADKKADGAEKKPDATEKKSDGAGKKPDVADTKPDATEKKSGGAGKKPDVAEKKPDAAEKRLP